MLLPSDQTIRDLDLSRSYRAPSDETNNVTDRYNKYFGIASTALPAAHDDDEPTQKEAIYEDHSTTPARHRR